MTAEAEITPSAELGPRPTMKWLDLELLIVDPRYQRDTSSRRSQKSIERIVEGFTWRRFQPITVAPVADGKFAILDGQHRVIAARMHPAVSQVPCYIVEAPELRAQADTFVAVNADRVSVNQFHMHHAKVAANDPDALHLAEVCRKAGVAIPRYPIPENLIEPKQTLAIGTIGNLLKQHGDAPVVFALGALAEAYADVGGQIRAPIIKALVEMHRSYGAKLDRPRLIRVLEDHDAKDLEGAAAAMRRFNRKATVSDTILITLVRAYNKGLGDARKLSEAA